MRRDREKDRSVNCPFMSSTRSGARLNQFDPGGCRRNERLAQDGALRAERQRASGDVEAEARDTATAMTSDGQTVRPYFATRIAMTRLRITIVMIAGLSLLLLISPAHVGSSLKIS